MCNSQTLEILDLILGNALLCEVEGDGGVGQQPKHVIVRRHEPVDLLQLLGGWIALLNLPGVCDMCSNGLGFPCLRANTRSITSHVNSASTSQTQRECIARLPHHDIPGVFREDLRLGAPRCLPTHHQAGCTSKAPLQSTRSNASFHWSAGSDLSGLE